MSADALFSALHFRKYDDSWCSALLVALAGAAFGTVRQWMGLTAAAAIMHASFNGLQFVAPIAASKSDYRRAGWMIAGYRLLAGGSRGNMLVRWTANHFPAQNAFDGSPFWSQPGNAESAGAFTLS